MYDIFRCGISQLFGDRLSYYSFSPMWSVNRLAVNGYI